MNASVITATALSKEERQAIETALSQKFGEISVEYHTEPELLGGMRIEAGDWVFDGTIARELNQLVHTLKW
jgi:F-type H+-transporting ATPase subunit delta